MNKKIIVIVIFILLTSAFYLFSRKSNNDLEFIKAERGDIIKEIFESGTLKKGEEIILGFKIGGKVEKIYVESGDYVEQDDLLAQVANEDLTLQLKIREKELSIAELTVEKLKSGARKEEIAIYESEVKSAEANLLGAEEALRSAKESLSFQIEDAYSKADDAVRNKVDQFFEYPRSANKNFKVAFTVNNTYYYFSLKGEVNREINRERREIEEKLNEWEKISEDDPLFFAQKAENYLKEISSFLDKIAFEVNAFSSNVPAVQTILNGYRTDLSTARSSVNTALNSLISARTSFKAAESSYNLAQQALLSAEKKLISIKAGSREEDITLQEERVEQIKIEIERINKQIKDTEIRAPFRGRVVDFEKKEGEIAQTGETFVSLLSGDFYEIEIYLYEGEISFIEVGNLVGIELVPFPLEEFKGEIFSINPAGRLIDGVVHYKITVFSDEIPEKAMFGMTADVTIKVIQQEDVLLIPEIAIEKRDGRSFVRVLKEKLIQEKEIETGLRGEDRRIEVISGLKEGERVLIK